MLASLTIGGNRAEVRGEEGMAEKMLCFKGCHPKVKKVFRACWHTSVISAIRKLRLVDQEFEAGLTAQ
jgi:hypothetical protein